MQTTEREEMSPDSAIEVYRRRTAWACRAIVLLAGTASLSLLYGAMRRPELERFTPLAVWGWVAAIATVYLVVFIVSRKIPGPDEPYNPFSALGLVWSLTACSTVSMVFHLRDAMNRVDGQGRPDNTELLIFLGAAFLGMLYLLGLFRRKKRVG